MFNLKRNKTINEKPNKKIKATSFNDDSNSEDELDDESKFQQLIKKKSKKISNQLKNQEKDKELDRLINGFYNEEEVKKKGPAVEEKESKYIKNLLESSKKRKREQLISKYKLAEKQISNSDIEVFESENYRKEKEKVLSLRDDDENVGRNDTLFYSRILQSKLKERKEMEEHTEKEDNDDSSLFSEEVTIEENKYEPMLQNKLNKRSKPIKSKILQSQFDSTADKENFQTQLITKLEQLIKSKVTSDDLQEYKSRYWERQKQEKPIV